VVRKFAEAGVVKKVEAEEDGVGRRASQGGVIKEEERGGG
jgi:hypothetical protein